MNEYVNGKNVTYLKHNFNKNGSAARNTGWKHSSGKYITFLDDDDEIDEQRFKNKLNAWKNWMSHGGLVIRPIN